MRVLKKSKKNPTFNEYFPQQLTVPGYSTYMFDYVFSNTQLRNKIYELFANGESGSKDEEDLEISFEFGFRFEHGEREVDNTITNNEFSKIFSDSKYDYLQYLLIKYQYKWSKLIDNVYAQTYNQRPFLDLKFFQENTH